MIWHHIVNLKSGRRNFLSTRRFVGWESALSIEIESDYIVVKERLAMSIEFLNPLVPKAPAGTRWWQYAGFDKA